MSEKLQSLFAEHSNGRSHLGRGILKLTADIADYGVRATYETDFHHYREIAIPFSERGAITGIYDPDVCDIGPDNGFWIKGADETGQAVHAQAMRFDDLSGSTLARHWSENPELFGPPGLNIDLEKSNFLTAPASHQISGGVCYHGDFWMARSARKFGLAPLLSQLAMLIALVRFSPDFIYGLIVPKNVKKGWAAQQGYLHAHPWAPSWHIRGENTTYDDYLVWVTGDELDELWRSGQRDHVVADGIGHGNDNRHPVVKNEWSN